MISKRRSSKKAQPKVATEAGLFGFKQIYTQPGYLIRRAHQKASAAFLFATRDLDLTAVQFGALAVINNMPGVDATRVSDLVSFDRTTIGHVIGRLEQKGLIKRRYGVVDKRTKLLMITEKGEQMVREVSGRIDDIAAAIFGPLSAKESETLLLLLAKLDASPAESEKTADPEK